MSLKNSQIMIITIIAGILLIIAGVSGLATWETIKDFVTSYIIDNAIVQFVFAIFIFIASLGGISVIFGGILIFKDKIRTGKFMISLGAGFGIIGLIFSIIIMLVENSFTISAFFSIGMIGLILSIIARLLV